MIKLAYASDRRSSRAISGVDGACISLASPPVYHEVRLPLAYASSRHVVAYPQLTLGALCCRSLRELTPSRIFRRGHRALHGFGHKRTTCLTHISEILPAR